MTTEFAEVAVYLLGALAMSQPLPAAGLGILITILLLARTRIHNFVSETLTASELRDALVLLAASLVVLPLLPNRPIGMLGVFNPARVWEIALIVMTIAAAGRVAMRALGPRYGLPAVGLAAGFVSSMAAIADMGARAKASDAESMPAATGAVLSCVSTLMTLGFLLAVVNVTVLGRCLWPLVAGGLVAAAYSAVLLFAGGGPIGPQPPEKGSAFSLVVAIGFAATVTIVLFLAALAQRYLGAGAVVAGTTLVGFADTHSAAFSAASLAGTTSLTASQAALAVLGALSASTVSRLVIARVTGGGRFFARVAPALILSLSAAWAAAFFTGLV